MWGRYREMQGRYRGDVGEIWAPRLPQARLQGAPAPGPPRALPLTPNPTPKPHQVHFPNGTTRVYGAGSSIRLTLEELVSLTSAKRLGLGVANPNPNPELTLTRFLTLTRILTLTLTLILTLTLTLILTRTLTRPASTRPTAWSLMTRAARTTSPSTLQP